MATTPISLTIGATDKSSATIAAIEARVSKFATNSQRSMDKFTTATQGRMSKAAEGMRRYADSLGRINNGLIGTARYSQRAFQSMGQIVPVLGVITGAASVAGMSRMVSAWGEWSLKVTQASRVIGIGAQRLTGLQGAANLAGGSADAMAGGLQTLGQAMYDAIGGRNAEAVVTFRTLGIAFQDGAGHARQAGDVMLQVSDKIAGMRDPFARAQVGVTLFGGAWQGLEPLLVLGSKRIQELQRISERYSYTTASSIEAGKNLALAQREVGASVDGVRNRIAERLSPVLTPMLEHLAKWIAFNPAVTRGINFLGMEVERLGHWIEGVDWDLVEQKMERWGGKIEHVVDELGGAERVVEGLMLLMGASFAAKVITPFATLASRIGGATTATRALAAAQVDLAKAQAGGGLGAGGLGRGIFGGLAAGNGISLLFDLLTGREQSTAEENINRPGSFLGPQVPAQPDTRHWWERFYKPGPGLFGRSAAPANPNAPNGVPRVGPMFGPQIVPGPVQPGGSPNHNPTNLAYYPGQPGLVGRNGRWGVYASEADGIGAGFNQMLRDQAKGYNTIASEIAHRSPPSENDTAGMIRDISRMSGLDPNATLNLRDPDVARRFMQATIRRETGKVPSWDDVDAGIKPYLPGGAPMPAPQAQGAPMALNTGSSGAADASRSTVRVEFDGKLPTGLNMRVANPDKADVGGPLVERPGLLGATP